MVTFTLGLTQINPIENQVLIQLEKKANEYPYFHQAQLRLNADEALKLVDEIKKAIVTLSHNK